MVPSLLVTVTKDFVVKNERYTVYFRIAKFITPGKSRHALLQ